MGISPIKVPRADVAALGAEIDQLVYSLYGLARYEIAIIEENVEERTPADVTGDLVFEQDI